MEKFFSFIAAVLFAGSMMADVAEIKFLEDVAKDENNKPLNDSVFIVEGSEFTVTAIDPEGKMKIDANNANFAINAEATEFDSFTKRLNVGGKSTSTKNYLVLNIPEAGTLRIASRTASGSATDRNLVVTQGTDTLYNQIVKDADSIKVNNSKCFPYIEVAVEAGSAILSYPTGALNFYSLALITGEDPVVTATTCAEVYSMAKNDVIDLLNPVTVTFANGKNVWVKDETASMLIFLPAASEAYKAGDVLSNIAGTVDNYYGVTEVKMTADQVAAITIAEGEVPEAEEVETVATTDVNKYIVMKGIEFEADAAFAEGTASNITMNGVVVRNNFKNGFAFEGGKSYDIYGVVTIYSNNPQVYFITAEEAGAVGEAINIDIEFAVYYKDAVAAEGWWLFEAENEDYEITISNTSTTQAAGVYTVEDLDAEHTYIYNNATEQMILITEASLTLTEAEDGSRTIEGTVTGDDGNTYVIKLVYKIPTAETTVNVVIPEWEVEDASEIFEETSVLFMGEAADGTYVQFALRGINVLGHFTDADCISGTYGIEVDGKYKNVYSMSIDISMGAELNAIVTADILCLNNTLYHVTTAAGQGINNIDAAVKAIKSIVNGQLVIEKNGVRYNVNGAVVK